MGSLPSTPQPEIRPLRTRQVAVRLTDGQFAGLVQWAEQNGWANPESGPTLSGALRGILAEKIDGFHQL